MGQRAPDCGFTTAAFADKAQNLAFVNIKGNTIDRPCSQVFLAEQPASGLEMSVQVLDLQKRFHGVSPGEMAANRMAAGNVPRRQGPRVLHRASAIAQRG